MAKCHLELACPGLAAAVLWSPALSLVIIQDVQRLPSRSPLMSCHISVNELHIFNFFITHRLMFSRILPVCPNLPLPAVTSPRLYIYTLICKIYAKLEMLAIFHILLRLRPTCAGCACTARRVSDRAAS